MAEQGVGDVEVRSSLPLYGQKALPAPIVATLNAAVRAALADPRDPKRLAAAYIEPLPMTPGRNGDRAGRTSTMRLGKLIQQLGIKADGTG